MTTADATRTIATNEARELRRRVHARLEDEYLRLRSTDRPKLLMMSAATAADGIDPEVIVGELEILDERIADLDRHFAALAADPTGPARGRVLLVDLGDGPELLLLSELELTDDQVVSLGSPLGAVLRGAVPGQAVTYRRPAGIGCARVLAAEGAAGAPSALTYDAVESTVGWYSTPPAEVLVGFDGSPSARTALAWAAREAALRARPLRVLHVREDLAVSALQPDELLTEGISLASRTMQYDHIRASAVDGGAARGLAERARTAELLVVGRGGEGDAGLGPVAQEVLASTVRATVVVPPRPEPAAHGRVVVGVRGSWHAADALAVGFAEANRRGAALLVCVIRDAVAGDGGGGLEPVFHAADQRDVEEADHLPQVVAAAGRAYPAVSVTSLVQTGHFAEVLVELSHSADLVVLGLGDQRTGMGRKDLLIATLAQCPVIVVREPSHQGGI